MTTWTCPKGHDSGTDDFCDVCGARIGAAAAPDPGADGAGSSFVPAPPASPVSAACPHCGMPQTGSGRFCEDCGYDHRTGKVPVLSPGPAFTPPAPSFAAASAAPVAPAAVSVSAAAAPAVVPSASAGAASSDVATSVAADRSGRSDRAGAGAGVWTVTVEADRAYFDANGIEGVDFPEQTTTRTVPLPAPQVRIGRRSVAKGTHPELDLSDDDPGVSHNQALLTLSVDGSWLLADLGSTNGTYVNDEQSPLTPGHSRPLSDGDRVHVGAWTTLTLHAP